VQRGGYPFTRGRVGLVSTSVRIFLAGVIPTVIADEKRMDTLRGFGQLFNRIAATAGRWAAKLQRKPTEAPIPPLQPVRRLAKAEPIPADPTEHAVQFAQDWYDRLEFHARRRMRELGIPEHRIGAYDLDFDFRRAAFFPKEVSGGAHSPGARINLNSGILNPELLAPKLGRWSKACGRKAGSGIEWTRSSPTRTSRA
jgi:hypothetical protein